MKHILTIIAALSLALGSSFAGCGITSTSTGKLKSFDKEKKSIVIVAEGKEVTATINPKTKGADGLAALVGKDVTAVISKHGNAESVVAKS